MTEPSDSTAADSHHHWWLPAEGTWTDRIAYSRKGQYAYRPNEVIIRDEASKGRAAELIAELGGASDVDDQPLADHFVLLTAADRFDVELVVAELIDEGHHAEPNYVLFADADPRSAGSTEGVYANPVYANPVYANPVYANPVYANPVYANPVYASPVYANPVYANPVYANVYQRTGQRPSSARPADALAQRAHGGPSGPAQAFVLDTGLAKMEQRSEIFKNDCWAAPEDLEEPDALHDGYLDPCAGHGTFAAGIFKLMLPDIRLYIARVISTYGDGDEARVGMRLHDLACQGIERVKPDRYSVVNLSFGGYALEHMAFLARMVRAVQKTEAVVVASAGNDGSCRPSFPACFDGVVSVGALGTTGPAPFTNWGPWVSACAPGVDLVSAFFTDFDGDVPPMPGSTDPDRFQGWARWSGTSFAAPIVAGALATEINRTGCTARQAVERLIDAPGLFQMPGLGTVINVLWQGLEAIPDPVG